jgi:hypothetical protein
MPLRASVWVISDGLDFILIALSPRRGVRRAYAHEARQPHAREIRLAGRCVCVLLRLTFSHRDERAHEIAAGSDNPEVIGVSDQKAGHFGRS